MRKFLELGRRLNRKQNITATVVADSTTPDGHRITTYELLYPRFIHAEFMTHRLFSRNAASSRAIPVKAQLKAIRENTAHPIHWGANQAGMQAHQECENLVHDPHGDEPLPRETAWMMAADSAAQWAEKFDEAGYHKQIVNRIPEPFAHINVVCTATEFDNFFYLRCHPDAQPEIRELANLMYEARENSQPRIIETDSQSLQSSQSSRSLRSSQWHLPYVDDNVRDDVENFLLRESDVKNSSLNGVTIEDLLLRVSASCCAQVSYRKNDTSIEKALKIYDQLVTMKPVHASPFEHQATPILPTHNYRYPGITHTSHRDGSRWSGNFKWWIQYRQMIPGHDFMTPFTRE